MAGQNKIQFDVGFNINRDNIKQLQDELTKITTTANHAKASGKLTDDLKQAGEMAKSLSSILESSFNKDLGIVNITKFNEGLKQANITSEQLKSSLLSQGNAGVAAYSKLTSSILNTNVQIRESNKLLNEMATTMASAAKWSIAYGIMNQLTDTISNAYGYVKQLDTSLTDIRIVTGDSANEMARFAEQANTAAKNLGSNTLDYTKSALEFYQQGLDDEAVANRTEATIKAANATGANAQEVAENLTAVWNGFQVAIGDETEYVDKLAAVADSSASNLNELATAMSKVASVANNVGVDMDQLTAQISTIIATTRQAPETVGNALKTIYARINDIKAGSDEAEMSLGNYTGKMAELGISVLDSTGHLRDTGDVMEEIGNKWGTMTREQQIYLAQVMAGQRQMNNMIALFDNWTQYSEMLNVSLNAQGALDEKNARYMESTQAHLNELKTTYQDLYSTLIDTDELNNGIDLITNAIQVIDNFLEGFGGGVKSITAFGTIVAFVFRDQIGKALGEFRVNAQLAQQNLDNWVARANQIKSDLGTLSAQATPQQQGEYAEAKINQENAQKILKARMGLTTEQQKELINEQAIIGSLEQEAVVAETIAEAKAKDVQLTQNTKTEQNSYVQALEEELNILTEIQTNEMGRIQTIRQILSEAEQRGLSEEQIAMYEQEILDTQIAINEQLRAEASARFAAAEAADEQVLKAEAARNKQGQHQDNFDRQTQYGEQISQSVAKTQVLTSSIMMLTTAIGTLSSLWHTWTDDSASGVEKLTQTVMALGFALPMLINSYSSLAKAMAVVTGLENASFITNARQIGSMIAAKVSDIATSTIQIGVHEGVSVALLSEAEAAVVAEGATAGLLIPLLPLIGALAAVGVACYALAKAYDYQSDRAKEATEAATAAKNQASELASGYTDLKSSLDELNNARSTLNGLKEGTQEWNEAVMALNEQMLQLLEIYPEIAKYLKNDNGLLVLDAAGQQAVLDAQMAKVQAAQESAFSQQITATNEQGLYEAQKVGREAGIYTASPEDIMEAARYFAENSGELVTMGEAAARELADNTNLTQQQAAALLENKAALLELNATAQGIETLESNRAANALNQNEQYKNSEYKDAINEEYQKRWDATGSQLTEQELRANKDTLAEIYSDLTGITFTEEQLKEIERSDLLERISNYRKSQELAEQEADIIAKGEEAGKKAAEGVDAFTTAGQAAIDKFNTENLDPSKTIAERNKAIDSIGEDRILSGDDNISAIQGALAQVGADMSDFFTLMPDGSYKLRTSAEDFKRIIDQLSLQSLSQQADDLNKKVQALESATALGADRLTQTYSGASEQQHQIDFLAAAGYQDTATLGRWQENIGNLSDEDAKALAEEVQNLINKFPELQEQLKATKEEAALAGEQLKNMVPRDDEVDIGELEDLSDILQESADSIEGLSDATDDAAYDDVAESLLRYKDAVEEISENYDDWIDALDNGDLMEQAEATDAIRDSMSDLLDLPFDSLSNDFVTNAENMDLMRRAAEGDTEAYDQLAAAATQDILAQVGLDDTDFQGKFTQLQSQINAGIDDIEVGAYVDDSQAIQAMNELINSADMTAQQATDLLASMGVDAQVTEQKVPKDQKQAFVDAIPQINHHPVTTAQVLADGSINETTVQVPEITYNANKRFETAQGQETVTALRVTSARKASGGGIKRNLAGGGGNSGGGGGGGGKGGKGGGGKAVKPPKETKVKKDPYHDVNIKLKDNERALKRLTREEKKLTGKEYLANLTKQNKKLEEQIRLQKEKQRIATREIKTQQQELAKYGFSFKADGDISNYLSKMEEYKRQVEALYQKAKAAPSEAANAEYEQAVKDYQELEKLIQEYEKNVEIHKDAIEKQLELRDQKIENSIKKYKYTIDLQLDFGDIRKQWKEFQRDVIKGIKEDDYVNLSSFALSQAKDDLTDAQRLIGYVNDLQKRINRIKKGGWDSIYGNNSQQAYENLQKYVKELMDRGEDIADLQKDIRDNWLDAIDAAKDAFDENVENFDDINDILEHNLDLLDMLYGDAKLDQAAKLYELQARNSMNSIIHLIQQRDYWKKQMDSAVVGSDVWKKYRDNWKKAMKDVNDAVKDSAQYMYDAYEAQIDNIVAKTRDALFQGNADLINTRWEHYLEHADRYLDGIQRGSKGLSLVSKYNDALNGKSLKQQKEIQKLQKAQLDNLNNQTEVRQIDYDIAEKELELLLKQQALEDARDNKNKLRLRRDSQGNYRYQYVADQEQISQAERELAETSAELYELVRQDYHDTTSYMLELREEFEEKSAEIMKKYVGDTKKQHELIAELLADYNKKSQTVYKDQEEMSKKLEQHIAASASILENGLGGQLQEFINMPDDIYEAFAEVFAPDGEIISLVDGLSSNIWNEGFAKMPEDVKQEIFNGFGLIPQQLGDLIGESLDFDKMASSIQEMLDANQAYQADLAELQKISNQNFDDLSTNLADSVIATENLILNNKDLINQYNTMIKQVGQLASQVDDIMNQYRDTVGGDNALFNALTLIGNKSGTQAGSAEFSIYKNAGSETYNQVDSIAQLLTRSANDGRQNTVLQDISDIILGNADISRTAGALDDARYNDTLQANNIIQALVSALSSVSAVDQTVNIDANFPGITAAAELENALNNLANQASQAASGNRRGY